MIKFIYFTDSHYGAKPVNRKDNYNDSILQKLDFIFRLAIKNKCILLHGGDLFDSPRINFLALNKLINFLCKYKEQGLVMHTIMGNEGHDGHKEQSPLMLLESVGLVKLIQGCLDLGEVKVIGAGHGSDPVVEILNHIDRKSTSVLLTHMTLTKEPVVFDHMLWRDFIVPVDVVCVAHYHPYQGVEFLEDLPEKLASGCAKVESVAGGAEAAAGTGDESGEARARNATHPTPTPSPRPASLDSLPRKVGRWFVAPGALSRRKKTKHDIDRIPKCVYIQVDGREVRFKEIDIKCEKDIWTNNLKLEIEESISQDLEVKEEIKNMKRLIDDTVIFHNIEDAITTFGKKRNHGDETIEYILKNMRGL